jgi:hypothetical protein
VRQKQAKDAAAATAALLIHTRSSTGAFRLNAFVVRSTQPSTA